ncbi:hypothetical protein AB0L06_19905 [Spirillospora sp. NPDC052269]
MDLAVTNGGRRRIGLDAQRDRFHVADMTKGTFTGEGPVAEQALDKPLRGLTV